MYSVGGRKKLNNSTDGFVMWVHFFRRKELLMKYLLFVLVIVIACTTISVAQPQIVRFKKLQEFLPAKDVPGFKRNKPTGSTQTAMGMTTSEAAVRYVKAGTDTTSEQSIEIKIADMALMPFAAWAMMYQQQDYEKETEEGFERTLWVKTKYKGIEKSQTGDSKSCALNFGVGNRFNVSMEASGFSDSKILIDLAESMDLDTLSKTEGEK
jgi:hypothetical protein